MKKEQFIQDAFNKMTPSEEQKKKIYNNILEKYESNDQKAIVINHKKKIFRTSSIVAACAALMICVGASIFKTAQDLNITRSLNSADPAESGTSCVTNVKSQFNSTEETQTDELPYSIIYMSEKKYVNGKVYSTGAKEIKPEYCFENINLSDMRSDITNGSELYSQQGTCISGNTLYTLTDDKKSGANILCTADINTGEITNQTELDNYYFDIHTDKNGNIYLSSYETITVYSKDLNEIYSVSKEELIEKLGYNTEDNNCVNASSAPVAVSPDGEIYIGYYNGESSIANICKLDSQHNIEFISDDLSGTGNILQNLFFLDNGNLIACSYDSEKNITCFNEISAKTGEIIANHGQIDMATVCYGLYERDMICKDINNQNVYTYNIDSQTTQQINHCQYDENNYVANIVLNDNTATVVSCKKNDDSLYTSKNSYIFVEDYDGNVEKEIPLEDSAYGVSFDVTSDGTIYYITFQSGYNEQTDSEVTKYPLYVLDSEYKSQKIFDFTVLSEILGAPPVFIAGNNDDFYMCLSDDTGKSTLNIYDTTGILKSTVVIPQTVQYISKMIQAGSELILVGFNPDNNQPYKVSVDTDTLQVDEPSLIDVNSDIISKDGSVSFSYYNDENTGSNQADEEKELNEKRRISEEQKIAEQNAEKYKYNNPVTEYEDQITY